MSFLQFHCTIAVFVNVTSFSVYVRRSFFLPVDTIIRVFHLSVLQHTSVSDQYFYLVCPRMRLLVAYPYLHRYAFTKFIYDRGGRGRKLYGRCRTKYNDDMTCFGAYVERKTTAKLRFKRRRRAQPDFVNSE